MVGQCPLLCNVGKSLGSEMPPIRYVDVSNILCLIWNVTHIFYQRRKMNCKHIRIYSKHDVLKANFINVEKDFITAKKIDSIIVKFKYEKAFRFGVEI